MQKSHYNQWLGQCEAPPSSGVPEKLRGKYLGMVESGTRLNGKESDITTGIDHLKELGVTHVQLLPVFDFASCPDLADTACSNWGYDPRNFNVPEERYSLTPMDPKNRVKEFKTMVNQLHQAGLRVIMDVVYNHTPSKDDFGPITDKYYTEKDLSGVGSSLDANQPMVSRMIQDSLEYWVKEYHIDGFRFDLVGIFDHSEFGRWGRYLNTVFPDRNLLIYGEPWNGFKEDPREIDRVRLGTIARIHGAHVGVFNSKYRDAIHGHVKDSGCDPGDCYAFNAKGTDLFRISNGSRGSIRYDNNPMAPIDLWDQMFAADPEQSINYVSAHDNLTLWDKVWAWANEPANNRKDDIPYLERIQSFAIGMIMTSQGVAFLHGCEEIRRTKGGNNDSYNAGDKVNEFRWEGKQQHHSLFTAVKNAIALRRNHPGLRMNTWEEIKQWVKTETFQPGLVVNHIQAGKNGDSWREAKVIFNSADNATIKLDPGTWRVAMEKGGLLSDREVQGEVTAEGTAVTVVYR